LPADTAGIHSTSNPGIRTLRFREWGPVAACGEMATRTSPTAHGLRVASTGKPNAPHDASATPPVAGGIAAFDADRWKAA
jgi:hypothetical protein